MRYTLKQKRESVACAEAVAKKERYIEAFKSQNVSDESMQDVRAELEELLRKISADPLAEKLLPQARIIVRMQNARREALEQFNLGLLINAVSHQMEVEENGEGWEGKETKNFLTQPFEEQEWQKFLKSLANGNKVELLDALSSLLIGVKTDLMGKELPPVAPAYQFPE